MNRHERPAAFPRERAERGDSGRIERERLLAEDVKTARERRPREGNVK